MGARGRALEDVVRRAAAALVAVLIAAALGAASAAGAGAPVLSLPVDCRLGDTCVIQNYVDTDPGPGRRDHACGTLSYQDHRGTDFRLPDLAAMRRGVAVLAAAPGVVLRVRDGMDDISMRDLSPGAIEGVEAGNAVVVGHGDGWETQYSHLKQGSIRVQAGDRVEAGQPIGDIGLSGNTEFPHVDFAVRHDNRVVDPFLGIREPGVCAAEDAGVLKDSLWRPDLRPALAYRAGGILAVGFAAEPPSETVARDTGYADHPPGAASAILALWAELYGGRPGDVLRLVLQGPGGRTLQQGEATLPKALAVAFVAVSANRPAAGWPGGTYRGTLTITRDGRTLAETVRTVEIR